MTPRVSRRNFLRSSAALAAAAATASGVTGCGVTRSGSGNTSDGATWVNDVHSQLNPTRVAGIERPRELRELARLVATANNRRDSLSVCGGRHAGGGQQFRTDRTLVDLSGLDRVLAFDADAGTIQVEAGIRWPAVLDFLHDQRGQHWSIHQKQGGADQLSLGGGVASNVHGRSLSSRPIVQDVLALSVVLPDGQVVTCDRAREANLFRRAVGGYGLFGVTHAVTLRLRPRKKLVRRVAWINAADAVPRLEAARDAGAWHGDFQFSVVDDRDDFCTAGLCSWYEPVPDDRPIRAPSPEERAQRFREMTSLAHREKARAMDLYRDVILAADGVAVNWSDEWQRGDYVPGYHGAVDAVAGVRGSEMLSELYVPRPALPDFLAEVAKILRADGANLIYGVVRLIERDDETFLAWAKQPYACVILNLHTQHDPTARERTFETFRRVLDAALARDGSYYLTYHRAARPEQTERCYPQFRAFLAEKRRIDPRETLDSDWYRHYRTSFGA
jgi:FAD/FMN-containing dehydrogenase